MLKILPKKEKCPACHEEGVYVASETVSHVVKRHLKEDVAQGDFHLCLTPDCPTGYYSNQKGKVIHKDDFKRPLGFKTGADPVIICYCANVKEHEIIETVVETGLADMKEIIIHLRGRMEKVCKHTSPTGHCCTRTFKAVIQKGLEVRDTLAAYGHLEVDSKALPTS